VIAYAELTIKRSAFGSNSLLCGVIHLRVLQLVKHRAGSRTFNDFPPLFA